MKFSLSKIGIVCVAAVVISACGGDDDEPSATPTPNATPTVAPTPTPTVTATPVPASVGLGSSVLDESHRFDKPGTKVTVSAVSSGSVSDALDVTVTIANATNNQPMSPALVVLHGNNYSAFSEGETASTALEYMAEGGDISFLITEAMNSDDYVGHDSTDGPIGPRSVQELTLTVPQEELANLRISLLSMLVNTNDAFTGLNSESLNSLEDGDVVVLNGNVWDSGTEENSEAAGTMPGPADGGEGFNAARSDSVDIVRIHAGVVTNALAEGIVSQ